MSAPPDSPSNRAAKPRGGAKEPDHSTPSASADATSANGFLDCPGGSTPGAGSSIRPWPKPSVRYGDAQLKSQRQRPLSRSLPPSRPQSSPVPNVAATADPGDLEAPWDPGGPFGGPTGSNEQNNSATNPAQLFGLATLRRRPSRWLRRRIIEAQSSKCLACGAPIGIECVDMDHIVPLALGGLNHTDNWAALCRACHKGKTAKDLRQIAKAKRQLRFQATGKGKALKGVSLSDPDMVRHVDGVATPRAKDGQ